MFLRTLRRFLWPADHARRAALITLGLLLAACLANLQLAPRPWKAGVAPRVAQGKKPMPKHFVATYNWYMAAANAALLAALISTIPLWVRRDAALPGDEGRELPPQPGSRPDLFTWVLLGGATVALSYFALPRLDHSLWGDEEFTYRRHFFGEYHRDDPKNPESPLALHKVSWLDTVYGYREPNNHIFQSILSRLCHEVWLKTNWKECSPMVGETALRLPPMAAGYLTLPALVALGAVLGSARTGGIAALLLAFHPWFQRYASEARGYAFVILFTVLGALLLVLAMRTGRWRWWVLYGFAQFLLMWSYVSAVFVPLVLNLFALAWLGLGWLRDPARREWALSNGARWLVVNLLSGMAFFQMMLPCLPMLQDYLDKGSGVPEKMGVTWFLDVGGHMLGGMDGKDQWNHSPWYHSWEGLAEAHPVYFWFSITGTAGFFLLGVARLAVSRRGERTGGYLVLAWTLLPISIAIAHAQITQHYYYIWYLIFALPCYALAWALGVEQLGRWLRRTVKLPESLCAAFALALGLILLLPELTGRLMAQRDHSIEPLKESVTFVRERSACFPYGDAHTLTGGFMMITPAYDPAYIKLESLDDLVKLENYARAQDKPLYLVYGAQDLARRHFPEIMQAVEHSGRYREVTVLPATWPLVTRHVWILREPPPSAVSAMPAPAEDAR